MTLGSGAPPTGVAAVRSPAQEVRPPEEVDGAAAAPAGNGLGPNLMWVQHSSLQAGTWTVAHTQCLSPPWRWPWAQIPDPSHPRQPRSHWEELTGNGSDLRVGGR